MKRTPFLTAAAFAAVLFACNNKESATGGLPIPKDAAMVMHINTSSLTSKLSWDDLKNSDWFKKELSEERDSFARKLMENPETSGIDMKGDFVMFMKKQGQSGYMVVEGKIKDAAAFEAMVAQKHKSEIQKDGDITWVKFDGNDLLTWNKSQFMIMKEQPMNNNGYSSTFTIDSLRKFSKGLFDLSSSESISGDDRFATMMKESGDMHIWVNSDGIMDGSMARMMPLPQMANLMKGNVTAMTLNFDNGKVSLKSNQFYGAEMAKMMEKMPNKSVSAEVINRIPMQNVLGVMATNFDPATAREVLKGMGVDGMANAFLGQNNLTLDDLITATNGQFVLAVSDVTMKQVPVEGMPASYTTTRPDASVLFATNINNQPAFDKLFGMAKPALDEMNAKAPVSYKTQNGWFALSVNSTDAADKFLAGGNNNFPFTSKISGHPFGMYLDLKKTLGASKAVTGGMMDEETNMFTGMMEDLVIVGGEFKDGKASMEMTLNLTDKSTNSLKQFYQAGVKMGEAQKKRQAARQNMNFGTDSTMVPPPQDVLTEAPQN